MPEKGFVISAVRNKRNHWLEAEDREKPKRKVFLQHESLNSQTCYEIEQKTLKFLEMPCEAWISSCRGKCSQTLRALCWDEQVETEQLMEHQSEDKDDSTVPSGLTFWITVEPPAQHLTWTGSSTYILQLAQPQGNGINLPCERPVFQQVWKYG